MIRRFWKRAAIAVVILGIAGAAAVVFVPNNPIRSAYERDRAQTELNHAATNLCACALGARRTSDVRATIRDIAISIEVGNNAGNAGYLARCKPYYEAAFTAYQAAAKLDVVSGELTHVENVDQSTIHLGNAVGAFLPFWIGEPDPSVPLPPAPVSQVLDWSKVHAIARESGDTYSVLSHDHGASTLGFANWREGRPAELVSTCTITTDWALTCKPVERAYTIERSDGTTITYADGAVSESRGGKEVRRVANFVNVTQSTQRAENWVVFKGAFRGVSPQDDTYPLSVVDLRGGVDAKPIVLSPNEELPKARYVLPRTYGVCVSDSLFVEMDPKIAVGTRDGTWKLLPFEAPMKGRALGCSGDAAMVTEWFPLSVQRCTQAGCVPVSTGDYHGDLQDGFAADEKTLYALRNFENAVLVTIVPLAHPEQRKTVFLTTVPAGAWFRFDVVSGALVIMTRLGSGETGGLYAVAVGPDGRVLDVLSNAK
jgi:hypothetical protein